MARNEILIPEAPEATVVSQFEGQADYLVPGIQVTLAKRIIKPGSNRVMCLAARTNVPLSDDDVASVSNLALRLSDGTNVALSLSFFNDGPVTAPYIPLNRYYYDPQRYYKGERESHLGVAVVATALAAACGIYYFLGDHFKPPAPKNPIVHKQPAVHPPMAFPAAAPVIQPAVEPNSLKSTHAGKDKARESGWHALRKLFPKPAHARTVSTQPVVHTSEPRPPKGGGYFVPPPPPVLYNLPTAFPNFQQFWQPPESPKDPAKVKKDALPPAKLSDESQPQPKAKHLEQPPAKLSDEIPPQQKAKRNEQPPAKASDDASPKAKRSEPLFNSLQKGSGHDATEAVDMPAPKVVAPLQMEVPRAVTRAAEDMPLHLNRVWVPGQSENASSAPAPGVTEYPPLERIVIPPPQ